MNFYVYEHWRTDRNECFYVGKGKGRRAYNMATRNNYHKAIVAKVIREGFAVEVKIVATNLSEEDAFHLEIERIKFWKINCVELANFSLGGEGKTGPHSEKHKLHISKALKGNKKSQSVIDAVIESNKNRRGEKRSIRTELHRKNLSNSLIGRSSPNAKTVICINDGSVYPSANAAAKFYGVKSVACISNVCQGKRKTAGGKVFKYLEDA